MDENRPDSAPTQDEPRRTAADYCAAIKHAEAHFQAYQDACDKVEEQYAKLSRLSRTLTDRELQIFWSNVEVLKPAIYARPPVPVATPRFKDGGKKALPRAAAEMLERSLVSLFDATDVDAAMIGVRNDVILCSRGVPWVEYVADGDNPDAFTESSVARHLDRRDFLHQPARKWSEVGWVAKRAYMTRSKVRKRFGGDVDLKLNFEKQEGQTNEPQAEVWEIWDRDERRVVWICDGYGEFLDEQEPWLRLDGFFPCPRPAYGTVEPNSLTPVPDFWLVKDQFEEINELTGRISALSEALKVRGFYPGGEADLSEAIETAMASADDNAILVPVANFAAFGSVSPKDAIVWLPLDQVAATVQGLVLLRRQIIDDVYQITGISDILRGATDPDETLGAQQLKSQWGSIRIRQRQQELVRVARDITRIMAEIVAEEFGLETLLVLSQVDLPRDADIAMQAQQLQGQLMSLRSQAMAAMADPQMQAMAAAQPQQAGQAVQQAEQQAQAIQQQIAQLQEVVTAEKVHQFLKDERLRPFALDIETDSTIQPDEDAEKQRRTEFLAAMTSYLQQAVPAVMQVPQMAELVSEGLKFTAGAYRAGRGLEDAIDRFADQMKEQAPQLAEMMKEGGKADPKAQAEAQRIQQMAGIEAQKAQLEIDAKRQDMALQQRKAEVEMMAKEREVDAMAQRLPLEMSKLSAEVARAQAAARAAEMKPVAADGGQAVFGAR